MRQPKWPDAQQFRRGEPAVHRPPGLSAEGLAADSEHVQAEQFLDCFVGIATLHEADGYQGPVRPGETVGAWIVAAEGTRRPEGCEPGSAAATVGSGVLALLMCCDEWATSVRTAKATAANRTAANRTPNRFIEFLSSRQTWKVSATDAGLSSLDRIRKV